MDIQNKIIDKNELTEDELNYFLNYVLNEVRSKLSLFKNRNLDTNDFLFMCDTAQSMLIRYFNNLNIKCKGVETQKAIDENVLGHSFVIASFNLINGEKKYIIDPTYIQFFDKEKCSADNFKLVDDIMVKTPYPGYFVTNNEIILNFLKDGYMEMNEENSKIYGDSFYKTKTGLVHFLNSNLEMSGKIYIKGFEKSDFKLTYTEEELESLNLSLKINNALKNNIK